jgi:hypothetical protein
MLKGLIVNTPSSSTPALSHLPISRRITPSRTRRLRNSRKWPWSIVSKNFRRSTSTIQSPPIFISCFHSESNAP